MRFTYQTGAQPLAGYTIQRGIHRGGFGEVYFAQSDGGKEVALKLLHDQDHETELRGVTHCLNLKHPNLVNIFDLKVDEHGDHWVVMEYVSGSSLEDVLASFPDGLPLSETRDWLSGLVAGVSHLHDRGIVHRDLKPANVYRENGVVKVGDVGLSKRLDSENRRQHTQSVGTVYYMAPEVARGQYGPEVDVYSLGVMLYEMISGKLPFTGETTAEILMKHLTAQPDLTPIPTALRSVVARSLEKDPRMRTPTARQLEHEFLLASGGVSELHSTPISPVQPPPIPPNSNGQQTEQPAPWISVQVNRPLPKLNSPAAPRNNSPSAGSESRFNVGPWHVWDGISKPLVAAAFAVWLVMTTVRGAPRWVFLIPEIVLISVIFREFFGKRRESRLAKSNRQSLEATPQPVRSTAARRTSPNDRFDRTVPYRNERTPDAMPQPVPPPSARRNSTSRSLAAPDNRTWNELLPQLGSSLGYAGLIASMLSVGVYLSLGFLERAAIMPETENAALFAAVSIIGSWLLIIGDALTRNPSLSRRERWLARIVTGAILGSIAYGLNRFLFVHNPSVAYTMRSVFSSLGSHPLTEAGVNPTWLGYVVFFASWMGIRRSSRDLDPGRKKRFSIPLTAAAVAMGYAVSTVFAFPQWYAMLWAGTISTTLQLASAWSPKLLSQRGA